MEHSNIRREDEGNRFYPDVGCNSLDFVREVLHVMQRRSFPILPFTAICVFCETANLIVTLTDADDDASAIKKYRDAYDELCRAYGDDV
jgi:hypothetical protein